MDEENVRDGNLEENDNDNRDEEDKYDKVDEEGNDDNALRTKVVTIMSTKMGTWITGKGASSRLR